ncbi:hypothetical protein JW905_02065 [bacterium]|nr:hypothetical protein [candidate division CSSED10-310 bacterium]
MEQSTTRFETSYTLVRTFFFTFIFALLIYSAIVMMIREASDDFSGYMDLASGQAVYVTAGLLIMSALAVTASLLLRRRLTGAALVPVWSQGAEPFLQTVESNFLKQLVTAEVPALCGLAHFLMTGGLPWFILFITPSLLLLARSYPSRSWWEQLLESTRIAALTRSL